MLVRNLDEQLQARGLRDHIRLMGPGLVENAGVPTRTHYVWMQWIAANMGDVLDAWGQHVYWFYNDTGRLEYRLRDIWHLLNEVIPPEQRKPTYMMEYGIRGIATCAGNTSIANTYYAADLVPGDLAHEHRRLPAILVRRRLGAARLRGRGEVGRLLGRLRPDARAAAGVLDDRTADGGLVPDAVVHSLALLFHTTVPGWQVVRVAPWDESDSGRAHLWDRGALEQGHARAGDRGLRRPER